MAHRGRQEGEGHAFVAEVAYQAALAAYHDRAYDVLAHTGQDDASCHHLEHSALVFASVAGDAMAVVVSVAAAADGGVVVAREEA